MKLLLVLIFSLLMPIALFSQSGNASTNTSNRADLPVILDPILQSYEWIMNMPSAKVDKEKYRLGFGDIITVITKGSYPLVLKSHVITTSEEIFIPQVGFISLRNKSILEAEEEFERVLSEQYGEVRTEVTLELPKQVSTEIYFPDGLIVRGMNSALTTYVDLILESLSTSENQTDNQIKALRPKTPADNPLLKSNMVQTPFVDKNINQTTLDDFPQYRVFDFRNYRFDFRNVSVKHADRDYVSIDLFQEWVADNFTQKSQINENAIIYLQPVANYTSTLSVSGDVKKSFVIPISTEDNYLNWIENVITPIRGQWVLTSENSTITLNDLEQLEIEVDRLLKEKSAFIDLHFEKEKTAQSPNRDGFWHFDTKINQFEFIQAQNLSEYLSKSDSKTNSFLLIRNNDWTDNKDRMERLLVEEKNPLMEDQLDFLQYLRNNDAVIPIDPKFIGDEYQIPLGYILVSFPKDNSIKLMGQFVQPGQFQFMSTSLKSYLELGGGLSSAATGNIYIIKSGNFAWMSPEETEIEAGDIIYAERIPLDNFQAYRTYKIQSENLKGDRVRTVVSAIGTVLSAITTLLVISRN